MTTFIQNEIVKRPETDFWYTAIYFKANYDNMFAPPAIRIQIHNDTLPSKSRLNVFVPPAIRLKVQNDAFHSVRL